MGTSGLGKLLVEDGLLTDLDFRTIRRTSGGEGASFARSVLAIGLLAEDELAAFLAEKTKWNVAPLDLLSVANQDALAMVDKLIMQRLEVVPMRLDEGVLHLAVVDPLDQETLSQIAFFTGTRVRPVIATLSSIRKALRTLDPNYRPARSQLESFMNNHAMAASRQLRIGEGRIRRIERKTPVARPIAAMAPGSTPRPFTGPSRVAAQEGTQHPSASHVEDHAAMPKADPPIGLETRRPEPPSNEDLLDEGLHQHNGSDVTAASADTGAPSDALIEDGDLVSPGVSQEQATASEQAADPLAAVDPLAELEDLPSNEFDTEPGAGAGDAAMDAALPDLEAEPSAAVETVDATTTAHPSDDQVEALFADDNLAELSAAPPVEIPAAGVTEEQAGVTAASNELDSHLNEDSEANVPPQVDATADMRPADADDVLDDVDLQVADATQQQHQEAAQGGPADDLTLDAILDESVDGDVAPPEVQAANVDTSGEDLLEDSDVTESVDVVESLVEPSPAEVELAAGSNHPDDQIDVALGASSDGDVDFGADEASAQDLTLAAGLNRAVLGMSMAQTLNKAIERVAAPLHLAGVVQTALVCSHNDTWRLLASWQMNEDAPQLAQVDAEVSLDPSLEQVSTHIGDEWSKVTADLLPLAQLGIFATGVAASAELYGAMVNGADDRRVMVIVSATTALTSDSVIGVAALDLYRRLVKKT